MDHGDPVRNMTYHRAESHALLYLTVLAPVVALGIAKLHREMQHYWHWCVAIWLGLFTHPWLDWMTIYGTQLAQPFADTPYGLGSMFIIDPLYTLPLVIGIAAALIAQNARGLHWNTVGLVVSTLYLGWAAIAQARVAHIASNSLAAAGIAAPHVLTTPTAFNTVLWRVVAMTPSGYVEGFYSFFDDTTQMRFKAYESSDALRRELAGNWGLERMVWFTRGFYSLRERDGRAIISDLRMGQEPNYVFAFTVAQRGSGWREVLPQAYGGRGDIGEGLRWVWTRLKGNDVPPPG
jgi:inner membrane protein